MSWITVICSSTAAACATLAAVHAVIWLRDRSAVAQLGFSALAAGAAWFTWAEFAQMRARTPADAAAALQWIHAAILLMVVGMIVFVRHYFRTARPWLGHAAWTSRLLVLLVSWSRPYSADYDEITGIVQVPFAGDTVSVVLGRTSAWHWIGQAGFALLVLFVIDASFRLWRTGDALERRRAATIGGTTAVFALLAPTWAALIFGNVVRWPHVEFLFVLPLVLAVGYELGDDVLRAARLARALQASEAALRRSEHRMALAADAARELSGRLINAQEDERRRIARDLHDDLSQRLALLAVDVNLLGRGGPDDLRAAQSEQVSAAVRDVASEVHRLAYQLHPAKLDQLGFVTAARGWCRDLGRQTGLAIEFVDDQVPPGLPPDVALCLYRIVQESLQNVVRHSGSPSARVHVSASGPGLRLVVTDAGRGFDPASRPGAGLGLVSMEERVRLLGGAMAVRSRPGAGTEIEVTIPVEAARDNRPDDEPGMRARETFQTGFTG